jgi:hypothetical protein
MAPTPHSPLTTLSTALHTLLPRQSQPYSSVPLTSIFAVLIGRRYKRSLDLDTSTLDTTNPFSLSSSSSSTHPLTHLTSLAKRQNYILAIPTTYSSLNNSPAPGAVAGITIGAIAGFIIVLYIVLSLLRLYSGRTFIETRIVERRTHNHNHSHSRSRSRRSRSRSMSEVPRVRRERETIVEERVRRERPEEVVVEEEEDDIVEVIEEHSPERRGKRSSGFRTVDPAEFGGGSRPVRKVGRR